MITFEQRLRDSLSHAYDIERELGGGGMSRVFVATELSLGRKVVIKLLSPELIAEVNRGRFRREIQVAAQLQHPHIVPLLSAGEDGDLVYYTMPFIMGESLKSALDKHGSLPVSDVVRVLYDVVDALAYAHQQGVIHRDIKPANILRSGSHALVTDFGVAKALNAAMPSSAMTSTGMAIGTPAYMAPEQLAGDPASDHRIDIYAVGLLAYELLSGKSPFVAGSVQGVLAAVLTRDPRPLIELRPDVPRRLSEMVMSCLSKLPGGRPPSAEALMVALDMFSTASGEIRTREHRVPVIGPSVPGIGAIRAGQIVAPTGEQDVHVSRPAVAVVSQATAPLMEAAATGERTSPAETAPVSAGIRPNNRRKFVIGGLALLLPAVVGALVLSQRASPRPQAPAAPPTAVPVIEAATPALVSAGPADVPPVDSQSIRDSLKKRSAQAEAAKRRQAAVKVDSVPKTVEPDTEKARRAAAAMLADAAARESFTRGATHTGGILGTRRKGDLQTQIDALQPFLAPAGLSYQQFKRIVEQSGVQIFDEFGRMVPAALQQFAGGAG